MIWHEVLHWTVGNVLLTLVTPFIMFSMCEHTVFTAASSFLMPNHFSTSSCFLPIFLMSTLMCRKSRRSVPRGPLTITLRDLMETSTAVHQYYHTLYTIRNSTTIDFYIPDSADYLLSTVCAKTACIQHLKQKQCCCLGSLVLHTDVNHLNPNHKQHNTATETLNQQWSKYRSLSNTSYLRFKQSIVHTIYAQELHQGKNIPISSSTGMPVRWLVFSLPQLT